MLMSMTLSLSDHFTCKYNQNQSKVIFNFRAAAWKLLGWKLGSFLSSCSIIIAKFLSCPVLIAFSSTSTVLAY